jgi:hypothetical protein
VKEYLVDPLTGLLATPYTAYPIKKRFFPGTEPKEFAPVPLGAKRFIPFAKLLYGPFHKNKFTETHKAEIDRTDESKARLLEESEEQLVEDAKKQLNITEDEQKSTEIDPPLPDADSEREKRDNEQELIEEESIGP